MLIFLRRSETTNPSAVIWALIWAWLLASLGFAASRAAVTGGGACKPKSPQVPLWGEHSNSVNAESTTSDTEKPASLSVRPLSPPLAATTSASQAHSSLIYLPCSQLLFLFLHLFCSLLPLSYVCILDWFLYVWLWRKCSCYSANPLATPTSFCMNLGVHTC